MKNMTATTTNPNVRFHLPNLKIAAASSTRNNQTARLLESTGTGSTMIHMSTISPMLSPKFDHLTLVRPPLSTSIDKQAHAIHKVIQEGRLTQLKYFLEMGLSPNCVDRAANKRTCLMLACMSDQIDYGLKVARVLIKHGADLNAQDGFGRTVLFHASTEVKS